MEPRSKDIIYIDRIKVIYKTPDYMWLVVGVQFVTIALFVIL